MIGLDSSNNGAKAGTSSGSGSSNLPVQQQAMQQAIQQNPQAAVIANAISNNNGVIDLRDGMGPIELYSAPTSTLVTTKGRNTGNSADADITAYVFNNDAFKVNVLQSDGSTASLPAAYNDGFSGKNIGRHVQFENAGRGLMLNRITFTAINAAGDQDITILLGLDLAVLTYTVINGRMVPKVLDISEAIRNTQFQDGILTVLVEAWVCSLTQLSWNVPAGGTVTANIAWTK